MSKSLYNSNKLKNIKRYAAQPFLIVSLYALSRSMQNSYAWTFFILTAG